MKEIKPKTTVVKALSPVRGVSKKPFSYLSAQTVKEIAQIRNVVLGSRDHRAIEVKLIQISIGVRVK